MCMKGDNIEKERRFHTKQTGTGCHECALGSQQAIDCIRYSKGECQP